MELEERVNALEEEVKTVKAENDKLRNDVIEAYKANSKKVEEEPKIDFDTYCAEHYDKKKKRS